ncbi:MAG: hypothetical protein KDD55_12090 [Bdellovibrionales bacterium]|nr:hypothetical protein [Bdellovibrionales bacterium]
MEVQHSITGRVVDPAPDLRHIRIFAPPSAPGEERQCLLETKPVLGFTHIQIVLFAAHQLIEQGWSAEDMVGLVVETHRTGREVHHWSLGATDLNVLRQVEESVQAGIAPAPLAQFQEDIRQHFLRTRT